MNNPTFAVLLSSLISSSFAYAGVEEQRLPLAVATMPTVAEHYLPFITANNSKPLAEQGKLLWQQAVKDAQSSSIDDRPLYWARLAMRQHLEEPVLLEDLENSSRGFNDIQFNDSSQIKILLTGFDPFFLDKHIDQSNPSGVAALALDGYTFNVNGKQVQVETALIPVRFTDFDNGIIETLLTPVYKNNQADMVITVSMGRENFDLERFPGKNRSANAPDNRNILTGANKTNPLPPFLDGKPINGPEFVELSLPAQAMATATGNWKINFNHKVSTLEKANFNAKSLSKLANSTSVEGSGGGYLSNEISYRAILLKNKLKSNIPTGHIHTPKVTGYDNETEQAIVEQIKAMLIKAAE